MIFRVSYSGIENYCISLMCSVYGPEHKILVLITSSSNKGQASLHIGESASAHWGVCIGAESHWGVCIGADSPEPSLLAYSMPAYWCRLPKACQL